MKSGVLVYKCKRCGLKINNTHTPDGLITMSSLVCNVNTPKEWGFTPTKEDIHYCDDNNIGVCELIGFEFDLVQ